MKIPRTYSEAIEQADAIRSLPRCYHGKAIADSKGKRLEPLCGCRMPVYGRRAPARTMISGATLLPPAVDLNRKIYLAVRDLMVQALDDGYMNADVVSVAEKAFEDALTVVKNA